jgi:hypothetical protein
VTGGAADVLVAGPDADVDVDGECFVGSAGVLGLCVRLGGGAEVLTTVLVGVPPAAEESPPLAILTVNAMRTIRRTTAPSANSRRRQYTDGGCDPTGRNMSIAR